MLATAPDSLRIRLNVQTNVCEPGVVCLSGRERNFDVNALQIYSHKTAVCYRIEMNALQKIKRED